MLRSILESALDVWSVGLTLYQCRKRVLLVFGSRVIWREMEPFYKKTKKYIISDHLVGWSVRTSRMLIYGTITTVTILFVPFIIRRRRNNQHYALIVPLLYSIYRLLHVSAVACHHQGASWVRGVTWNPDQIGGISYSAWLCYMIYHLVNVIPTKAFNNHISVY
jgi:hypothetical protein